MTPRRSLIIFDEVQKCPRAREAIKALVADHRFDYLETGSLISIKKNVEGILIPSEEDGIDMYPMDFEEFLWAMGNEVMMPYIRERFEKQQPMGEFHREALHYFRQYLIVGGMPQAVAEYAAQYLTHRGEEWLGLYADVNPEVHQEVRAVPEHALCAAHKGCGAEGQPAVPAAIYDGTAVGG